MARPVLQGMAYFPPPTNRKNYLFGVSVPLMLLERKFGPPLAYAFYFRVLELLYGAPGCTLAVDDLTIGLLAQLLGIKPGKVSEMFEWAAAADLFDEDAYRAGTITNKSIRKNVAATFRRRERERARHQRKAAARTGAETPRSEVLHDEG